MKIWRIYTQAAGRQMAPRLASKHYSEDEAAKAATRLLIGGLWVRITVKDDDRPEPSRWD